MFARIHQKMELSRQRREKANISAALRLAVAKNYLAPYQYVVIPITVIG